MTGNVWREKVNHEFKNKKDFERTVETLANVPIEQRGSKQLQEAIKIVKKMEFFSLVQFKKLKCNVYSWASPRRSCINMNFDLY